MNYFQLRVLKEVNSSAIYAAPLIQLILAKRNKQQYYCYDNNCILL